MQEFTRYAVYYAPRPGALADFAAGWLGWDPAAGRDAPRPEIAGLPRPLADLTEEPHKYGFHGTLKPPFRLAEGRDRGALQAALDRLAAGLAPVRMEGLRLARIGSFLALTPVGGAAALTALAAQAVEGLDPFRAPLTAADRARRRPDRLGPRQIELLDRWGYPYVMEEFRFHLTLTGRLSDAEAPAVEAALAPRLAPLLPSPFVIEDLVLFGEAAEDGRFHILHRAPLG